MSKELTMHVEINKARFFELLIKIFPPLFLMFLVLYFLTKFWNLCSLHGHFQHFGNKNVIIIYTYNSYNYWNPPKHMYSKTLGHIFEKSLFKFKFSKKVDIPQLTINLYVSNIIDMNEQSLHYSITVIRFSVQMPEDLEEGRGVYAPGGTFRVHQKWLLLTASKFKLRSWKWVKVCKMHKRYCK